MRRVSPRQMLLSGAALMAVAFLNPPAAAQAEYELILDRPLSHWNWSGMIVNLGYLEGVPDSTFNLEGRIWVELTEVGGVPQEGRFVVMQAAVVPQFEAFIPGAPGYPNLVDVWVEDLVFSVDSPPFPIAADGSYTVDTTVLIQSGMLHAIAFGTETVTDMSGITAAPNPTSGVIVPGPEGYYVDGFQIAAFDFTDPGSGLTITFNMNGWVSGRQSCSTGPNTVCSTEENSTGAPAHISATGSYNVASNSMELYTAPTPNQFGIFFYSSTMVNGGAGFPLGDGRLCIGPGGLNRLYPPVLASGNVMTRSLDFTNPPSPAAQITAGSTWYFQTWFRDPGFGPAGFNLSNAVEVPFCQ
ncbi:MAG: hypothetical protein QF724_09440 [Planctomycetota bacterium]|nr:hypothetical protein [Planctomycetota bacterium]